MLNAFYIKNLVIFAVYDGRVKCMKIISYINCSKNMDLLAFRLTEYESSVKSHFKNVVFVNISIMV